VDGAPAGAWRFVSTSYETQPRSGRVDRAYVYERTGRTVGGAPIRARVELTGAAAAAAGAAAGADLLAVRAYVDVPDAWERSYRERRARNDLYAQLATPGLLVFGLLTVVAVIRGRRRVRWRPASLVGAVVGLCFTAAGLNEIPLGWFTYDTATAPAVQVASSVLGALVAGAAVGLWVTVSVAAAELLTRRAFPHHHDWFAFARHAGAPAVAGRVLGGYALAALGFAYVTLFYLATRSLLGWWVPTGSLDDPNQIATPLPWVSAIGTSLFAGIWEEAVFRAVPLAMLAIVVRDRPGRRWWMLAGVIVTALVFGFGHANYPSWPAYSRGVELFAEAALWAVLYLMVGLPTTIVAHVLYDLAWFGLFALNGRGAAYATTATIVGALFSCRSPWSPCSGRGGAARG
jgi:membrane protease YdiL (CAAX protease family)